MKTFYLIVFVLTFFVISLNYPHVIEEFTTINSSYPQIPKEASPSATPVKSPTPKPLTREEMEKLYGPCTVLPVLYYHHIEPTKIAHEKGHTVLHVDNNNFKSQISDLQKRGVTFVNPDSLTSFFDTNTSLTPKAAIITFDDGYDDLYTYAFPIIKELNVKTTIFLPTGLTSNKGYLSWDQINEMKASGLVYFANHTWSHKSLRNQSTESINFEIGAAETQLKDNGLNSFKIFAYPYGEYSDSTYKYLLQNGYKLAFSTKKGSLQCKGQRYFLPRIGAGNLKTINLY
jgi:peptidoglycan/xylan/chitin deacetylase (PgdA/CDA1 family)